MWTSFKCAVSGSGMIYVGMHVQYRPWSLCIVRGAVQYSTGAVKAASIRPFPSFPGKRGPQGKGNQQTFLLRVCTGTVLQEMCRYHVVEKCTVFFSSRVECRSSTQNLNVGARIRTTVALHH